MIIDFVTSRCARLHNESAPIVLGISPFNSYFSEEVISDIAAWASLAGSDYYLYIPDGPTKFTLQAIGYEENKAKRKARRQNNYLKNKIYRALRKLGQSDREISRRLLNSHRLDTDRVYQRILAQVHDLWEKDESFRLGCTNTAHWVLKNQPCGKKSWSCASLELAAQYFLAELPLFLRSPEIVGSSSAVFCYHQCPAFVRMLYEQVDFGLLHDAQGFVIRRPKSGPDTRPDFRNGLNNFPGDSSVMSSLNYSESCMEPFDQGGVC